MTTTSATSSTQSIVSTLGSGSGIDINALVANLVTAQYQAKNAALSTKSDKVDAQISDVAKLQSGVTDFSSALQSLIDGGTLVTQPTSSNSTVLQVSALPGAKLASLSASVVVKQLATAQAATTSATGLTSSSVIGSGTLTLRFGKATVDANGAMTSFTQGASAPIDITIDDSKNTLQGVADQINAANAGVTATIVSDVNGARLTIKSATGESQAFTLTATEGTTPGLSQLNVGVGQTSTTLGSKAQDAKVIVDGVTLQRSSNTISDLITGVKLNLVGTSDTAVSLGASRPTSALGQAVQDFVGTFNQVYTLAKADTDPKTGTLVQDTAAANAKRSLSRLTLTPLISTTKTDAPTTLAEIGVGTNTDGTLKVDATRLASALANFPDEVEAMFASSGGLMTSLKDMAKSVADSTTGLVASTAKYNQQKSDISDQQDKVKTQSEDMTTRLTAQFAKMDSVVAAYKSTQAYLTNQIAAWNKSS